MSNSLILARIEDRIRQYEADQITVGDLRRQIALHVTNLEGIEKSVIETVRDCCRKLDRAWESIHRGGAVEDEIREALIEVRRIISRIRECLAEVPTD